MSGLPAHWSKATLGDVITGFEAGRNLRASSLPASEAEFGVLKISSVSWGKFQPQENKALLPSDRPISRELVRKGDLLISRANTTELVGAPVLVDRDYDNLMLPDKILRVKYNERLVDPRYLLYSLRTKEARTYIEEQATGTSDSMRNLSQPKLSGVPIRLAPLAEQKRIADKLDRLLAAVDTCKARLDAIPAILKRFRQSVLAAAVSGELTDEWRNETHTSAGRFSRLGSLGEVIAGQSISASEINLVGRGEVYVTGPEQWNGSEIIANKWTEHSRRMAPDNSIFVTVKGAGVGKTFPGRRAAIGRDVYAFVPNGEHDHMYVLYAIQASAEDIIANAQGLIPGLSKAHLTEHRIYVPMLSEQREIVDRVTSLLSNSQEVENRRHIASQQLERITHALLTKAFRGQLVHQDPNDEPASVLLGSINPVGRAPVAHGIKGTNRVEVRPQGRITIKASHSQVGGEVMNKVTKDSLAQALLNASSSSFTFDELRNLVHGDYESIQSSLFELLSDPASGVCQRFDMETRQLMISKVQR